MVAQQHPIHRVLFVFGGVCREIHAIATDSYAIDSELGATGQSLDEIGVVKEKDFTQRGIYIWEGSVSQSIDLYEEDGKAAGSVLVWLDVNQNPHGDDEPMEYHGTHRLLTDMNEFNSLVLMEPTKDPTPGPFEGETWCDQ